MKHIISAINKEIDKNAKVFHKASDDMEHYGELFKEKKLTEAQGKKYDQAMVDYRMTDKALSALYTARKVLEAAIEAIATMEHRR